MNNCCHNVCFKVKCNCCENHPSATINQNGNQNIQNIYSQFATTLETELRNQHQKYSAQLDDLNNQIFNLKNTVTRLELRNKKDLSAENQLRKQYNFLLQELKDKELKVIKEVQIVQKIKEVLIEIPSKELESQIKYWKKKIEENNIQFHKMKMERDIISEQNINLKDQIQKLKKLIKRFQYQLEQKYKTIQQKDRIIEKITQHNTFLKNNKEIVIQTKHLFPQFKAPQKIRTETKVQTIYIEKPIEKLVFVDVQKRIKEFIQPQRPVVNRIISCQPNTTCACEQDQNITRTGKTQMNNLYSRINQLEGNLTSYKQERQHLVDVIGSKNSELNYLQAKMKLFGETDDRIKTIGGRSTVNVIVHRSKQQKPVSQKPQTKQEKHPIKK